MMTIVFHGGVDASDAAIGRLRQRRSYLRWPQRALDHLLAVCYSNAATLHLRFVSDRRLLRFFSPELYPFPGTSR